MFFIIIVMASCVRLFELILMSDRSGRFIVSSNRRL